MNHFGAGTGESAQPLRWLRPQYHVQNQMDRDSSQIRPEQVEFSSNGMGLPAAASFPHWQPYQSMQQPLQYQPQPQPHHEPQRHCWSFSPGHFSSIWNPDHGVHRQIPLFTASGSVRTAPLSSNDTLSVDATSALHARLPAALASPPLSTSDAGGTFTLPRGAAPVPSPGSAADEMVMPSDEDIALACGAEVLQCLPYGTGCMAPINLHYPGCGCPIKPEPALNAHVLDELWCRRMHLAPTRGASDTLRVAYVIPHHHVTGGLKIMCEHLRLLSKLGHNVLAIHWSDRANSALPPWCDVKVAEDYVLSSRKSIAEIFKGPEAVPPPDVVVVGWFTQVAAVLAEVDCPVMYFEQGHEYLFGDPIRFCPQHNYASTDRVFHKSMHLPMALAAVSNAARDILFHQFGRTAVLIPNGIDIELFRPGPRTDSLGFPNSCRSVLLVGNPNLPLKGFDVAMAVLSAARRFVDFKVVWVLQKPPLEPLLSQAKRMNVIFVLDPPQEDLPALYRGHTACLFCSRYEGFGMPVLEAMAAGTPVVCTLSESAFAKHAFNCLVAAPLEVAALTRHLLSVLTNQPVAAKLAINARETACRFSWDAVAMCLDSALVSLAHSKSDMDHLGLFTKTHIRTALAALRW